MMNGVVLAYSRDVQAGVISGHDGCRHYFRGAEWQSATVAPRAGINVVFKKTMGGACNVQAESPFP
jgi:hypothetical protein